MYIDHWHNLASLPSSTQSKHRQDVPKMLILIRTILKKPFGLFKDTLFVICWFDLLQLLLNEAIPVAILQYLEFTYSQNLMRPISDHVS